MWETPHRGVSTCRILWAPRLLLPVSHTVRLTFRLAPSHREIVVADLAEAGVDAFEETPEGLVAHVPEADWTGGAVRDAVDALVAAGFADAPAEARVEDQNWNAVWEATVQPMAVGPFVIAPTWAEPTPEMAGLTLLRIDPKMAFGTGYHATTRLSLRLLADRVPVGGRVLDVGTGTGVLALAALALGAESAVGVDIDPWSVENACDNAVLNGVADRFDVRDGSADDVLEVGFGLVCANILRPVLTPMLTHLDARRAPGAPIVLSGLLAAERDRFADALASAGLAIDTEAAEGDWWGCVAV